MPLFSKPIFISALSITEEIKSKVKSLSYYQPQNSLGQLSNNTYVLDEEPFAHLKKEIGKKIKNYVNDVLEVQDEIDFYITNSWVTVHDKGDYAPLHIHTNSLISGTLYINIPEDDDSLFQLHAPDTFKPFGLFKLKLKNLNFWNSATSSLKPETGTLILFPSDLAHSTTAMTSDKEYRYCLAFNVFVRGDIYDQEASDKGSINRVVL